MQSYSSMNGGGSINIATLASDAFNVRSGLSAGKVSWSGSTLCDGICSLMESLRDKYDFSRMVTLKRLQIQGAGPKTLIDMGLNVRLCTLSRNQ